MTAWAPARSGEPARGLPGVGGRDGLAAVSVGGRVREGRRGADRLYLCASKCKHHGNGLLVAAGEKPRPEILASQPMRQDPRVLHASARFATYTS